MLKPALAQASPSQWWARGCLQSDPFRSLSQGPRPSQGCAAGGGSSHPTYPLLLLPLQVSGSPKHLQAPPRLPSTPPSGGSQHRVIRGGCTRLHWYPLISKEVAWIFNSFLPSAFFGGLQHPVRSSLCLCLFSELLNRCIFPTVNYLVWEKPNLKHISLKYNLDMARETSISQFSKGLWCCKFQSECGRPFRPCGARQPSPAERFAPPHLSRPNGVCSIGLSCKFNSNTYLQNISIDPV